MPADDDHDTVVHSRHHLPAGEPEDLDADTRIHSTAPAEPEIPTAPARARRLHPLVEPPRGHPPVVARSVAPRAGFPSVPGGLTVPWYRIRVNRHEPIPLDLPALIGRRPLAPRVPVGAPPRLVRVPSPGREVSGTHIELRQQGASVIVTDLRSTNGTIVSIPGTSSQKLRQGESLVVSAGTVVDIGDGNTVEILPMERLV